MAKKSRSTSGTPSKVETITLESDTDDVAAATTANGQHSDGDGDDNVKLVDGSDAGSPSAVKAHDEAEYKPDSPKQKRVAAPADDGDAARQKFMRAQIAKVISKAHAYTKVLEEFRERARAAAGEQAEDDANEDDVGDNASPDGKRKRGKNVNGRKKKKLGKNDVPPLKLPQSKLVSGGTLKDYQLEGMNWMIQRYLYDLGGGILADEMGTGKTLQTISFLAFLYEHIHKPERPDKDKPSIVVMPKAVLDNWANEFAPELPVLVYRGTKEERAELRRKHLRLKGLTPQQLPYKRTKPYPIILITYEILRRDIDWFKLLEYDLIACDEAHKVKNSKGKSLAALRQIKGNFRLLLTGTPLQNSLHELFSLLSFVLPKVFDDEDSFIRSFQFDSITGSDAERLSSQDEMTLLVTQLQEILQPFMLRRRKKDVVHNLPLKKEYVLKAPITVQQKLLLDAAKESTDALRVAMAELHLRSATPSTAPTSPAALSPAPSETGSSRGSRQKGKRGREIIDLSLLEDGEDEAASSAAGENSPRRTRPRHAKASAAASVQSYSDQVDAADDDEFEEELVRKAEQEERAREKALLEKLAADQKRGGPLKQKNARLSSQMTNLRQIANHPFIKVPPTGDEVTEDVVNYSGKMMLLDRILPELIARGHKVLIFSQFTEMLDILQDYLALREMIHYRLDGGFHKIEGIQEHIDDFNTSPCGPDEANVFLVSTKAGGVGINLIGADTVILFDSDWNPQNDLQAMDRAHRIGQTKPVLVYRLVSDQTVDEVVLRSATKKRKLERVVLGADTLAGDAKDLLDSARGGNKGKGRKNGAKDEMLEELMKQVLSVEGQEVTLAGAGAEILTDEQLEALLDRSDSAMQSNASSERGKGTTIAGFEVVETVDEETVQEKNRLADLLGESTTASAETSDADDDE
ncbi:hypothetical protein Rhopal_001916-T1 [Rhodotorula paludigena]|uniref:Uncharacterized protein n=1 Tax=Rhodotorula paludigena TaxID=86838 RepID=A0AAV5GGS3_9BASI|nr:hypothetical protein Rhopal_001916-T1 [Rhodotorula paludigena]